MSEKRERPSPWTEPGDYIVPYCLTCGGRHGLDEPCVVEMHPLGYEDYDDD